MRTEDVKMQPIYCHKKEDVPKQVHFAIVKFKQVSQPGYDKGDPPYNVDVCEYIGFLDQGAWEAEIRKLESERGYHVTNYVAFVTSKPATTKINIEVDPHGTS